MTVERVLVSEDIQVSFNCKYLGLGTRNRLGILLVYCPPCLLTGSLTELTEVVLDLLLRTPRMIVLGEFNIHAKADLSGQAQDMAAMTAMGLS